VSYAALFLIALVVLAGPMMIFTPTLINLKQRAFGIRHTREPLHPGLQSQMDRAEQSN
jgi:hypothetical protein